MTSKEEAELLFKQQRRSGGPQSIPEYEQRALAERTKIARASGVTPRARGSVDDGGTRAAKAIKNFAARHAL
jgi:hypothetical protein